MGGLPYGWGYHGHPNPDPLPFHVHMAVLTCKICVAVALKFSVERVMLVFGDLSLATITMARMALATEKEGSLV